MPLPVTLNLTGGEPFTLKDSAAIVVDAGNDDVARTAELLALVLRPSTGYALPVSTSPSVRGVIALRLAPDRTALGAEGYELTVTSDSVRIVAKERAGLFHGTQTLRQLFPAQIEQQLATSSPAWMLPALTIVDQPRFAWRGSMLDVARHFFTVDEVKQYIDLMALYKLNTFHIHLADDQGWRIEIKSHPKLTEVGGSTQVGGGPGGFYTQAQYADIVKYAADRFIMVVPEIDMPAHINAALISYPELSCGQRPPALYTGTEVGFSAICPDKEESYTFLNDVIGEIAAITPGPYFHIGGDEVKALTTEQYNKFIERVQDIVTKHGKRMIGWEEIAHAQLKASTLVQQWQTDTVAAKAVKYGSKIIMSPGPRMYLDMKYNPETELGLRWAGLIDMQTAYEWDPTTYMKGVSETDMVGIEAPLWSETIRNITAAMFLAVPRLPALAEVGWTPQAARNWNDFRRRIAAHAPRWNLLGFNFYESPQIPWQ